MKIQLTTDAGSLIADWNVLDGTIPEVIDAIEDAVLVEDAPELQTCECGCEGVNLLHDNGKCDTCNEIDWVSR